MCYIILVIFVAVLIVTPFKGLIELSEKEIAIIDNYKGFITTVVETSENSPEDMLSGSGMSAGGMNSMQGMNAGKEPNMFVLGDLDGGKKDTSKEDEVKFDIKNYM